MANKLKQIRREVLQLHQHLQFGVDVSGRYVSNRLIDLEEVLRIIDRTEHERKRRRTKEEMFAAHLEKTNQKLFKE